MITIPIKLPDELARRLLPMQDRLPDIIERGLREIEAEAQESSPLTARKAQILKALQSTGIVSMPEVSSVAKATRHSPIEVGGQPASEIIIEQRGQR